MSVSVIIPAHNAAATLAETLESLLAQTFRDWEAVIVDDGSTDGTAALAASFAARDPRIRVLSQPQRGVSAARNAGWAAARAEWLLFLDADDWIAPDHLERMLRVVRADPSLSIAYCGWAGVAADGTVLQRGPTPRAGDLFEVLACGCLFTINSCLIRRALVQQLGGFDPALKTCEDWDLWQRVARMGLPFGIEPMLVAPYRWREDSASTDGRQMLMDGLRVMARGHAADPRVPNPAPQYRNGLPADHLPAAQFYLLAWCAGLAIGSGRDARPFLELLPAKPLQGLDPVGIAEGMFDAGLMTMRQGPPSWLTRWPGMAARIGAFADALEGRLGVPGFSGALQRALERLVLERGQITGPMVLGTTEVVVVDVEIPILDLRPAPGVQQVRCLVRCGGLLLGAVELPVCGRMIPAGVVADAVAAEHAWTILGQFFMQTLYPPLAAAGPDKDVWQRHDRIGWETLLRELWGRPDWPIQRFYQPELPAVPAAAVRGAVATVEISAPLPESLPARTACLLPTLGGAPLGLVPLPPGLGPVSASQACSAITTATALELCVAAVREGVLGRPLTAPPTRLRERLQAAADRRPSTRPSPWTLFQPRPAVLLGRRAPAAYGTSASRQICLPASGTRLLQDAAKASGEPVVRSAHAATEAGLCYAPAHLSVTAPTPVRALQAVPRTGPAARTDWLPILMYHRVTPEPPVAGRRYCVSPQAFEAQLQYLRDQGFYSVGVEAWAEAIRTRRPLPGRAVALTFDDGYQDFLTHAWPLLKRYGFSASVFLVTDAVGSWNWWDREAAERCALLTWGEVLRLQDQGVVFGSHTTSHRPLSTLSFNEIVREGARSRAVLARRLKHPVWTMAYPYGVADRTVEQLTGGCGYLYGLTVSCTWAGLQHRLLALPRQEIAWTDTLESFARKVAPPVPEP